MNGHIPNIDNRDDVSRCLCPRRCLDCLPSTPQLNYVDILLGNLPEKVKNDLIIKLSHLPRNLDNSPPDLVESVTNNTETGRLVAESPLSERTLDIMIQQQVTLDQLLNSAGEPERDHRNLVTFLQTVKENWDPNAQARRLYYLQCGAVEVARSLISQIQHNCDNSYDYLLVASTNDEAVAVYLIKTLLPARRLHYAPLVEKQETFNERVMRVAVTRMRSSHLTRDKLVQGDAAVVKKSIHRTIRQGKPIVILWTEAMERYLLKPLDKAKFSTGANIRWILKQLHRDWFRTTPQGGAGAATSRVFLVEKVEASAHWLRSLAQPNGRYVLSNDGNAIINNVPEPVLAIEPV